MEILPGIEIIDLALWLKKEKILVISDLHLGYEEMLEEKGLLMPRFQLEDILKRLEKILKGIRPEKILLNGDLKHEYGKISSQEWREVLRLFDFLLSYSKEIILIKGNHDLFLAPIARRREVKVVKDYPAGEVLICHGDRTAETKAKILVIGHEHPAIVLKEGAKAEKYKCFLKGKFGRKKILVMPSFSLIFEGTNILREKLLSPYLKDISKFEVYVVGEKVYDFGKVKKLTKLS